MRISDLIGSIGVAILLIAFILILTNRIPKNGLLYLLMNLIGSSLAALASFLIHYTPFIVLEISWMVASLFGLWKYFVNKGEFPKST
jgi:hypothetical protein